MGIYLLTILNARSPRSGVSRIGVCKSLSPWLRDGPLVSASSTEFLSVPASISSSYKDISQVGLGFN